MPLTLQPATNAPARLACTARAPTSRGPIERRAAKQAAPTTSRVQDRALLQHGTIQPRHKRLVQVECVAVPIEHGDSAKAQDLSRHRPNGPHVEARPRLEELVRAPRQLAAALALNVAVSDPTLEEDLGPRVAGVQALGGIHGAGVRYGVGAVDDAVERRGGPGRERRVEGLLEGAVSDRRLAEGVRSLHAEVPPQVEHRQGGLASAQAVARERHALATEVAKVALDVPLDGVVCLLQAPANLATGAPVQRDGRQADDVREHVLDAEGAPERDHASPVRFRGVLPDETVGGVGDKSAYSAEWLH
mmetsp:Transcript_89134/g.272951  ORF Transcript_89134/g.272951 Transcript_89134/m.272951 type:complete len:304 (+) Transcript_89134:316-1227(+)